MEKEAFKMTENNGSERKKERILQPVQGDRAQDPDAAPGRNHWGAMFFCPTLGKL